MTTWIAEESVVFVHADGHRAAGRIALGAPIVRAEDCACPISLEGMEDIHPRAIFGDSTLQALLLGARFLGMRLHDFLERGGRVLYPDDSTDAGVDVGLDTLFGTLLAAPRSGPDAGTPN